MTELPEYDAWKMTESAGEPEAEKPTFTETEVRGFLENLRERCAFEAWAIIRSVNGEDPKRDASARYVLRRLRRVNLIEP